MEVRRDSDGSRRRDSEGEDTTYFFPKQPSGFQKVRVVIVGYRWSGGLNPYDPTPDNPRDPSLLSVGGSDCLSEGSVSETGVFGANLSLFVCEIQQVTTDFPRPPVNGSGVCIS